ncbi:MULTISPECIES: AMP-binding protein [Prochlorococcus]|uniref:AMP-binding protein n=1 Tax=Prochlorococcus TaxID=1218 RepID=UPI000533757A|nr:MULTISPECIES: AMP-binding protein [Prochlorococcus]KGG13198.1 O-succinylbenzoic acid--CoA ligase [Prochlorococcus sp. MIT 0601]
MNNIIRITCDPEFAKECSTKIDHAIIEEEWVQLTTKYKQTTHIAKELLPKGPGIIMNSGGSTQISHQCLLPVSHLNQSAFATKRWLETQEINPAKCFIFHTLPIHHVSGLMSWWRSRCWGSQQMFIKPSIMKNPQELIDACNPFLKNRELSKITSLVPTQLNRLLQCPAGITWLQSFNLIWIGGAPISKNLIHNSRNLGIRLSPCYGASETTAMVTAQRPDDFLAGQTNLGRPLIDVELRIGENKRLQIKTPRLVHSFLQEGKIAKITLNNGWWDSGDFAELINYKGNNHLRIIGRVDTAIHSGGETIFPEVLKHRLLDACKKNNLPIKELLFIPVQDAEWGERLVSLVRLQENIDKKLLENIFNKLEQLVGEWTPCERPMNWYICPELKTNECGKWEILKWKSWVESKKKKKQC